jgi:2-oxoglutarate ferredoxin oxidoreductase subunit alpha
VGPKSGDLLVVSWGGTYGACLTAVKKCQQQGLSVAHCHLRYLNPFPRNFSDLLNQYKRILVPELNLGQLCMLIRGRFLKDAVGYNKVQGRPFVVEELVRRIQEMFSK